MWIADAHRGDGRRVVVRADEKLAAFVELNQQSAILLSTAPSQRFFLPVRDMLSIAQTIGKSWSAPPRRLDSPPIRPIGGCSFIFRSSTRLSECIWIIAKIDRPERKGVRKSNQRFCTRARARVAAGATLWRIRLR
jgi:hypothetical protein